MIKNKGNTFKNDITKIQKREYVVRYIVTGEDKLGIVCNDLWGYEHLHMSGHWGNAKKAKNL